VACRTSAGLWDFHYAVLEAKSQVKAQFGADSNELQAVGLKKKSEYKSPKARKTPSTPPSATSTISK
jgi:hypothetical protein